MLWDDDPAETPADDRQAIVDLGFRLQGRRLPVDHAYGLAGALRALLPWLDEEPGAGVHPIRVPESGNGWRRPGGEGAEFHLSRRTRLNLRLPAARVEAARALTGATLDVSGHRLRLGEAAVKPLLPSPTLFAHHVCLPHAEDEIRFESGVVEALRGLDIEPRKLLCGLWRAIGAGRGSLSVRAVLIADLAPAEACTLLERGIGTEPLLGCGLFVPHKGIAPVGEP